MQNQFNHQSGDYLEIDSAKIYYEVIGNKSSPALLFLHGGFGNIEDFNSLIPSLKNDFRIVGIDSRGQGKSTTGGQKLSYAQLQKDVESVLARLEIDTLQIIGFSDGGIIGYRIASLTNLKIEKLVTIGSRWHFKNTAFAKEILAKVTGESWRNKFPKTFEAYQKLNPEPSFNFLAESLVEMWLDENSTGYPNEEVENISCPMLIVRGDEDHLISRQTVFEIAEISKNSNLLNIPFAGHAAFVDQKEIFIHSLNEFLST